MESWQTMFGGVQKIVRDAESFSEGLTRTISLARRHPALFDESFWNDVDQTPQWPYQTLIRWAEEGLANFQSEEWSVLFLDLGDGPDIFHLYQLNYIGIFTEDKLRPLILSETVVGYDELAECLAENHADSETFLSSCPSRELSFHHIKELQAHRLNWRRLPGNYNGDNGYLLWLAFGALALIEPLRNAENCQKFLGNCPRLYLMVGFEEIFFYAGTVTPNGLISETS